jgi:hypothetical protein
MNKKIIATATKEYGRHGQTLADSLQTVEAP